MSLTSRLKSNHNPTRLYFEENFPAKKNFTQEWRKRTKNQPSILPQNPTSSYPWALVGHAIDYRIRLFFEKYSAENTVAASGASMGFDPDSNSEIISKTYKESRRETDLRWQLWSDLSFEFDALSMNIVGKISSPEIEHRLAMCCMALSYYETQTRSGQPSEPLLRANTLEDLFSGISETVINDLVQIFRAFFESDKPSLNNVVLNPAFIGSRDVGGADGDIILDHILWDIKTTKNPSEFHNYFWPYQLIGYCLLDYDNQYALSGCGFYLTRQACWIVWSLEELFGLLGSNPEIDISAHRERFRNSIKSPDFCEVKSGRHGQSHLPRSPA